MREVIVHNASTNPAIPFPKSVEQYRGYLIGWGVVTEVNSDIAETDTHAIVEREDGSIAMVFPTRIKFAEPYATTAKLAATPAQIARACGMENEMEKAQEVSATNPPKGWRLAKEHDDIGADSIQWYKGLDDVSRWVSVQPRDFGEYFASDWNGVPAVKIEVSP